MPVVPQSSVPSVSPIGATGGGFQSSAAATPSAFGAGVGLAEEHLGQTLDQVGDKLAGNAIRMQEDANASVAKDLFLQGDIEVGKLTVAYNQLEGLNKVQAYDKYVQDIEAVRQRLKDSAPNNDVAKRFDQDFARRVGYSVVDGARGAAAANKAYNNQTSAAVRQNTLSHIAVNAQDNKRFETELQIGLDTYRNEDEYKGMSPEAREQKDRDYVTAAWSTRLQAMAKDDPLRARDLLAKIPPDKIDGGKRLQLENTISQQIINVDTRVSSDKIIQSGALVSPELREAVKKFEGYRAAPYPDFKQVSSGYGTKYQPGDENLSPEQLKAAHEQRLDNELAKAANIVDQFAPGLPSGTRNALIDLTFNAGSSWTSAGLGASIRAGDYETAREKIKEYNQAGGRVNENLVARRKAEADWFGGNATQSDPTSKLTDAMDKARERALEVFPNDPGNQARYLDALQSRIRADHSVMETATRQMQLDMKNTVQKELLAPDSTVISYDRLSPAAKQAYDLSPPSQQSVFDKQMRLNATRDVPLTKERQDLYDTIHGEALVPSSRDKFLSRNVSDLDLPRPMKSRLQDMQNNVRALVERGARSEGIIKDSQAVLNDAGIRQSASDTNANQQFLQFKGALDQRVESFINENKRPPNPKEGREMVKDLTREIVLSPGRLWDTKGPAYQAVTPGGAVVNLNADDPQTHYSTLPSGTRFLGPGDTKPRIKP